MARLPQEVSGLARPGTPPKPDCAADGSAAGVRLPASIDRADVATVVESCLARTADTTSALTCDARSVRTPRLSELDAIARLALSARWNGLRFRLEHASPALLDLIALCGLSNELNPGGEVRDRAARTGCSTGARPRAAGSGLRRRG